MGVIILMICGMGYMSMSEDPNPNYVLMAIFLMGMYGLIYYMSHKDAEDEGSSFSDIWPVIVLICCCSPLCCVVCLVGIGIAQG